MNTNYSRLKYPALGKTDKITITGYKGLLPKYREAIDKINEAESDAITCSDTSTGMDSYDKEKLNEYAKELFALCLEKRIHISITNKIITICINGEFIKTYLDDIFFNNTDYFNSVLPIWELIEKVKQL